ncbi:hypothetical protein BH18ACT11_BH18ACT11_00270 [soil metagenome]
MQEGENAWEYLFVGSSHDEREEKVLHYIMHRIKSGAHLADVVEEEYVRRNASQKKIDEVISNPELVHAARQHMESALKSGEPRQQKPSR